MSLDQSKQYPLILGSHKYDKLKKCRFLRLRNKDIEEMSLIPSSYINILCYLCPATKSRFQNALSPQLLYSGEIGNTEASSNFSIELNGTNIQFPSCKGVIVPPFPPLYH